ncbi:hypothetical protein HPB48_004668 [Haemaphysalis longicornis]|uniref:Transmembrane protein n=1 Tax=Haemaphysalis longicornis TaxID=44386 RepID=A0A9J6G1I2_HAELO|nr:hypothetical protein HPB48_004668 [Haemaphysalis longicornis]
MHDVQFRGRRRRLKIYFFFVTAVARLFPGGKKKKKELPAALASGRIYPARSFELEDSEAVVDVHRKGSSGAGGKERGGALRPVVRMRLQVGPDEFLRLHISLKALYSPPSPMVVLCTELRRPFVVARVRFLPALFFFFFFWFVFVRLSFHFSLLRRLRHRSVPLHRLPFSLVGGAPIDCAEAQGPAAGYPEVVQRLSFPVALFIPVCVSMCLPSLSLPISLTAHKTGLPKRMTERLSGEEGPRVQFRIRSSLIFFLLSLEYFPPK